MHKYTVDQKAFLIENTKGTLITELTAMFNARFGTNLEYTQIKAYCSNHKLTNGLDMSFKKGAVPFNKGTKGLCNVGGNKTSFKAGQLPKNTDPIGTEKTLADGYVWVKVNDFPKARKVDNWKQKHRLMWEEVNGPIPKGSKLMFADGDRNNITLDNLILISLAESLIMNKQGLVKANPELTKTGALIAKVIDKTYKSKRRKP